MSVNQKDFKPLIIYGKKSIKPNTINNIDSIDKKFNGGTNTSTKIQLNASSLEKKIDNDTYTIAPTMPKDIAKMFIDKRTELKLKQIELAQRCSGGVPVAIIQQIENGSIILNAENRKYINIIARFLKLPALNLPK
jgi:DNA-binding transcriptional regulator YiaG